MPGVISGIPKLTGARLTGNNGHVYVFHQMIGSGQFGVVYKCEDPATSELYACKVLNMAALSRCMQSMQMLQREVNILLSIQHRRLLSCHEQLCANNLMFIFTQFVPGGSLSEYIAKHSMTIDEVGRAVYQILEGVEYLHQHNICHRDLKPDNILCTDSNPQDFVIADFGLSRTFSREEMMSSDCGSSLYAAPEVFTKCYTAACDMWSIGIMINEIRGPYSGVSLQSKEYDDSVPSVAQDFVSKLLQYAPECRMTASDALKHPWMVEIKNKFFFGDSTTQPAASSRAQAAASQAAGAGSQEDTEMS